MENTKNDLGYLGKSFQLKILWQLLVNREFADGIIPNLTASYFDDHVYKMLMNAIKNYHEHFLIPPSIENRSIFETIKGGNLNEIDKEATLGIVAQLANWEGRVKAGQIPDDSETVKETIWFFVKQQEAKKIANEIFEKIEKGNLHENVPYFEEKFKWIIRLGEKSDQGEDVFHDIEGALEENYRKVIPTGIKAFDEALAGGLGKGEMGLGLIPYGIGKTTLGTIFSNRGFEVGANVLQIIFEDFERDIKRKHYAIWSKVPLSQLNNKRDEVNGKVKEFHNHHRQNFNNRLVILKLDQDGITIPKIRSWILNYEKVNGIKFDLLILDYLDCVESHKPTHGDTNAAEVVVVKSFLALLDELDIPGWTFVQGNRSSLRSDFVHADQMGGSIKRGQKTHFLFSAAKSPEQKMENLANIQFIKSRMTRDGQIYENAIFNNDTLEVRCIEGMRPSEKRDNKKDTPLKEMSIFNDMVSKFVDQNIREKHEIEEKITEENNSADTQLDKKIEEVSLPVQENI